VIPIPEDEKENESASEVNFSKDRLNRLDMIPNDLNKSAPLIDKSQANSSRFSQKDSLSSERNSPKLIAEGGKVYALT
jgi:hypothetical protein